MVRPYKWKIIVEIEASSDVVANGFDPSQKDSPEELVEYLGWVVSHGSLPHVVIRANIEEEPDPEAVRKEQGYE